MTLYQVLHELQIVLALVSSAFPKPPSGRSRPNSKAGRTRE